MAKLIKRYQNTPGPITREYNTDPDYYNSNTNKFWEPFGYHWTPYNETEFKKYSDDFNLKNLRPGQLILVDQDGKPIPKRIADHLELQRKKEYEAYQKAKNQDFDVQLDNITITPTGTEEETLEEVEEEKTPSSTSAGAIEYNPDWWDWKNLINEQNSLIARERDNLRKNNAMVDHLFFTLPFSAPLLGIAGAELIGAGPAVAQWPASPAGQAFGRSMLYGEGLNQISKSLGYEDWGEVPYRLFGGKDYANLNQWAKLGLNFTNPGYFFNPASKVIDPMASLIEQAMKSVPTKVTTGDLAKEMNRQIQNMKFELPKNLKINGELTELTGNIPDQLVSKYVSSNGTVRLRLPSHTKATPREFVLEPQGNNKFRVHMRTWDGEKIPANLSLGEKNALFESVYNELPEGAEILIPESSSDFVATRGTVARLRKLLKDPRFSKGNEKGSVIYADKDGSLKTYETTSFIKNPSDNILKGLADAKWTYNHKTGTWDISYPRGLRRLWAEAAKNDVVQYYGSDFEYNRLLESGATPEQAQAIMATRRTNAEEADVVFRNLNQRIYGDSQNINGQAVVRLNQNPNAKHPLYDFDTVKHTMFHELGGHGSSLNIGEHQVTIPENQIDVLTNIYKHNETLRPQLRPFYQAVKDGNFELAKQLAPEDVLKNRNGEIDFEEIQRLIKYYEENLEYSARAIGNNIAEYYELPKGWNIQQLRQLFTDESVDNLLKRVWSKGTQEGKNSSTNLDTIILQWNERYPNSGLELSENPQLISEKYLQIGLLPMNERTKAIIDLMLERWGHFNWKPHTNPNDYALYWFGPSQGNHMTLQGYPKMFDKIKLDKTYATINLDPNSSIGGFYSDLEGSNLNINHMLSRQKPYYYTQIHEGVVHPTDRIVESMLTPKGKSVLSESSNSLYGKMSLPDHIYDRLLIDKIISKDSLNPRDARTMNWEMITKIYARIAKEKGIDFQTAIKTQKQHFNQMVDNMSVQDVQNLMLSMDSHYLNNYVTLMKSGTPEQAQKYVELWKGALKIGAVFAGINYGLSDKTQSNRKGGKLRSRKINNKNK